MGDCLDLPFPEDSFDLLTIAFGLRNLADRALGLSEMLRVLKPGGRLIVLEFTQPYFWFSPFYYMYLKGFLLDGSSGDRRQGRIPLSGVEHFLLSDRPALTRELEQAVFLKLGHPMTFSIVALHYGEKPELL